MFKTNLSGEMAYKSFVPASLPPNPGQGVLSAPKTLNSIRYVAIPQELLKVLKGWR